jgi:serine/threonine protein phosphatase PrpC
MAAEMVAAGLVSESEALALPQAHVVTRWIGEDVGEAGAHVTTFRPPGPGVLLLCSDGLWNYQPDAAGLARMALPGALTDPLGAAAALVRFAVGAGGADNITVVLAPFPLSPRRGPAGPGGTAPEATVESSAAIASREGQT